jgi:broad specificity phosphatase PhoE
VTVQHNLNLRAPGVSTPKRRIFLVRHGRSAANDLHSRSRRKIPFTDYDIRIADLPDKDIPLCETGIEQAKNMPSLLKALGEDLIHGVVSNALRARQTVEHAGLESVPGISWREDDRFMERCWGSYTKSVIKGIEDDDLKDQVRLAYESETHRPFGGESWKELEDRLVPALLEFMSNPAPTGVLVAHGNVITKANQLLCGIGLDQSQNDSLFGIKHVPNCAVFAYERFGERWTLRRFCDSMPEFNSDPVDIHDHFAS